MIKIIHWAPWRHRRSSGRCQTPITSWNATTWSAMLDPQAVGTPQSLWQPLWSQGTELFVVKFLRCLVQGNWTKAARAGNFIIKSWGDVTWVTNPNVESHPIKILVIRPVAHFIKAYFIQKYIHQQHQPTFGIFFGDITASSCATTSLHPDVELSTATTCFQGLTGENTRPEDLEMKCKSERMWS